MEKDGCPSIIEDSTYVQYDTSEVNVVDSISTPIYTMLDSVFENLKEVFQMCLG